MTLNYGLNYGKRGMHRWQQQKGFTIIELLVVVAILAMVLSIVLAVTSTARARGRDARRESDMRQLENALALYVNTHGQYPVCALKVVISDGSCAAVQGLVTEGFLPAFSRDPAESLVGLPAGCGSSSAYGYCYLSNGATYTLEYHLETNSILQKSAGWHAITP